MLFELNFDFVFFSLNGCFEQLFCRF